MSIIDLVKEGTIASPRIYLSDELIDRFNKVWHHYLGISAIFSPDITKPFFHMQHERFWRLVEFGESDLSMVAEDYPYVEERKQTKKMPTGAYSIKAMHNAFQFAEIDGLLFQLLQNADVRAMLRVILINEYLTNQPTKTMTNITQLIMALPFIALVA